MRLHKAFQLLAVLAVAVLTACGSSSTATSSPAPTASSSPSSSPTAVATTLDPCVLVTSSEASTIAGVTYGVGREETYSGSKGCTYGYQTLNVFMDLVAQAVDAHTARAEWAQEKSKALATLQNASGSGATVNFNVTDVSTLTGADLATVGTGTTTVSGHTFSAGVIYILKGATFFTFSDIQLGTTAPSAGVMETEAQTVLGRLP